MKYFSLTVCLLSLLLLTGCVSRQQADAMLERGCAAGVNALMKDGRKIGKVLDTGFQVSPEGQGFRHVDLTVTLADDWLESKNHYDCVFEESFGFLNMNYTASIYQIRIGSDVYGKAGGQILGTAEDFIKLTDAIRAAMYGNDNTGK